MSEEVKKEGNCIDAEWMFMQKNIKTAMAYLHEAHYIVKQSGRFRSMTCDELAVMSDIEDALDSCKSALVESIEEMPNDCGVLTRVDCKNSETAKTADDSKEGLA